MYHDMFGFVALVSSLMAVRAKNLVHFVSCSIPAIHNTLGLIFWLVLDFSATISLIVHIGFVVVPKLFIVMMFHIQITGDSRGSIVLFTNE